ncbi:MAG: hypothetical protein M3133_05620 [Actinomycetota bacterium]|nr:hypothetical protein [Actinomycetota bacterium]
MSAIALCFFPLAHNDTLLRPLGLDAEDPRFVAQRKVHVVELLLNGLRERAHHGSSSPVRGAKRPTGRPASTRPGVRS